MSDTPRTDKQSCVGEDGCTSVTLVPASFARRLERELAVMTAAKNEALAALKCVKPLCSPACLYSDDCDYALCQEIKKGFVCRAAVDLKELIAKLEEVNES